MDVHNAAGCALVLTRELEQLGHAHGLHEHLERVVEQPLVLPSLSIWRVRGM